MSVNLHHNSNHIPEKHGTQHNMPVLGLVVHSLMDKRVCMQWWEVCSLQVAGTEDRQLGGLAMLRTGEKQMHQKIYFLRPTIGIHSIC